MEDFENNTMKVYDNNSIQGYKRYINYIFLIWRASEEEHDTWVSELNGLSTPIKFKTNKSLAEIDFLDLRIFKDNTSLATTLFQKPMDRNSILLDHLKNIFSNCPGEIEGEKNIANFSTPISDLQKKINEVFDKIQLIVPNATFTYLNRTTNGQKSKIFIASPRQKYCIGEEFVVQIDMYDHLGRRKEYGGDFIRARIFSDERKASVCGRVEDFNNGSYHVSFPLYWEGQVKVSAKLFHPSEGISALWRARHASLGVLGFEGKFVSRNQEATTKCGFKLNTDKEVCEYVDPDDENAFYCIKPEKLPCGSLHDMKSFDIHLSYLSKEEQQMFKRSNIGVEIPTHFKFIDVAIIQSKALSLLNDLKAKKGEAAKDGGWFDRFKKRSNLHNIKVQREAAAAETEAAESYPSDFAKIIEDRGYSMDHIFNVDENGLFWKKMPARTFIARQEKSMPGYKPAKDRITLLLGGNASEIYREKKRATLHTSIETYFSKSPSAHRSSSSTDSHFDPDHPHQLTVHSSSDITTQSCSFLIATIRQQESVSPLKSLICETEDTMETNSKPKCQTGMSLSFPSGYFLNDLWIPVYCNLTPYRNGEDYIRCLQGKKLFLIGDSTIRQFIMHFTEGNNIVKYFGYRGKGFSQWQNTLLALNMEKDIYVSFKRHGFPLESSMFYYFQEDMYTSRQIDMQGGGKDTIIMITMGQHFRQFPLHLFIKRAINIRRAIERLFLRSPDTKVIIKTENIREITNMVERLGDFHGYCQYLVLREVFKGLDVGFVDAWDMSVSSGIENVHPPGKLLENIMSLSFTFACL
ncbi:LOW QUALITY PROTEIN: NXPE family member 4-like [Bombina bombina]|uniref:LOW QUALITY PROTEIN: NXPE family member 4-like n=1 Tax=Bombina bombina TaxID=8345 RepID=UPI00235B0BBF|nr:LOW QUALITY PROTEIN: NXPE family member 4-like [Bombina bombina]